MSVLIKKLSAMENIESQLLWLHRCFTALFSSNSSASCLTFLSISSLRVALLVGLISEWLSSPESSTWTMWPCVRNLLSYSSACSFTALLPWLQGGRGMMCACTPWWHFTGIRTRKKKRKSEVLRRDHFTNTKDGCRCRQPWETHLENHRGAVWLTAFEKCIALSSSSLSPPSKLLLL